MDEPRSSDQSEAGSEDVPADVASREDWEWLPKYPDLHRDLGYELLDLDVIDIADSNDVLFMPREESMDDSDTFVIVRRRDLVPLER